MVSASSLRTLVGITHGGPLHVADIKDACCKISIVTAGLAGITVGSVYLMSRFHIAFGVIIPGSVAVAIVAAKCLKPCSHKNTSSPLAVTPQSPSRDLRITIDTSFLLICPGIANRSANCWVNASLQLFLNLPKWREMIEDVFSGTVFGDILQDYNTVVGGVSRLDSQKVREWLAAQVPGSVVSDCDHHEDPVILFDYLLSSAGRFLEWQQGCQQDKLTWQRDTLMRLYINNESESFSDLLSRFFDSETEEGKPIQSRFITFPDELTLQICRFGIAQEGERYKIATPIAVPNVFKLQQHYVRSDEPAAEYRCNGFIYHEGSLDQGHYVACIKKVGRWWMCNDDRPIQSLTSDEVRGYMAHSYIYHFSKALQQENY